MLEFYMVAIALVVLASLFVVFPVLRRRGEAEASSVAGRGETNILLFKQRQRELQAERDSGAIGSDEYQLLITELQRRLLEEVPADGSDTDDSGMNDSHNAAVNSRPSPLMTLAIVAAIAIGAALFYSFTGYKTDWLITEKLEAARAKVNAGADASAEREELLALVEARLQRRTDNDFYRLLKANLEMEMGNFGAAVRTLDQLMADFPDDPAVMSQALEARYLQQGRRLDAAAEALAQRILAIDPDNARTLGLLGISRFEARRYVEAIDYWQRLQSQVGPFSPNGRMINQGIERARSLLAQQGGQMLEGKVSEGKVLEEKASEPSAAPARVQVEVSLGENITADADASVFVYARAFNGPRMPLAVRRLTVADLPARVTLDDSMAMAPGMNLSSVERVEIVARISRRGIANPGSGDIEGIKGPVKPAATEAVIPVVIDRVLP